MNRRAFLLAGGAATVLAACGDSGGGAPATTTTSTAPAGGTSAPTSTSTLTAADFDGLGPCAVFPESAAGPFPLDEQFDRSDITEGLPGHPMRLGFRVIDASCAPVARAAVEVWHTDATGDYSAFVDNGGGKDDGPGTTFLRGTQAAGDDGIVEFLTIYPGWYRGRAVHVHVRVNTAGAGIRTGQVYFDEAYTAGVYRDDPYAEFGAPDTTNAADGLAGDPAAEGTLLHTVAGDTDRGAGTIALLDLGVSA